jgi:hypothetical protein
VTERTNCIDCKHHHLSADNGSPVLECRQRDDPGPIGWRQVKTTDTCSHAERGRGATKVLK